MPIRRPAFLTRFFSTPPTSDDRIRLQDLWHDPELPHGRMRSVVDALNEKHWQITLAGRIVSVVEALDERYLVIEALPGNQMLEDFKELVWALGRLQERTTVNVKVTNSWTRLGTNGWASGLIYVHLTSTTRLKTHAWERDESWVVAPTLIEPALSNTRIIDPIESGAAVFCVANLLRIDNTLHENPPVISSQWVIKSSFLVRLHLPTAGAEGQNAEMVIFLNRGSLPPCIRASEELPIREDAGDP